MIKTIYISFDNMEEVKFDTEHFDSLWIGGITTDLISHLYDLEGDERFKKEIKRMSADRLYLEILESGNIEDNLVHAYSEDLLPFDLLENDATITNVSVEYDDGINESYAINWYDLDASYNENQNCYIKDFGDKKKLIVDIYERKGK